MIRFNKTITTKKEESFVVTPGTYFAKIINDDQVVYYKFIIPEGKGYDTIMVMDDRFKQSISLIPCENITSYSFESIFSKEPNTCFIEEAEFMAHFTNVKASILNSHGNEEKK